MSCVAAPLSLKLLVINNWRALVLFTKLVYTELVPLSGNLGNLLEIEKCYKRTFPRGHLRWQ